VNGEDLEPQPRLTVPVGTDDHARGPQDAPVTLVEYGDFECPQCQRAYPIVRAIEQRFEGRLRFVFRNFPLTNVHPNAQAAAEAAEWAAGHGAFWSLHDALYERQGPLTRPVMLKLVERLGLDAAALEAAWRDHGFVRRIKAQFKAGLDSGVTGTPTFFLDEIRHDGGWDLDTLAQAIEARAAGGAGD
jgi:protein-disulfide isomerase